MDAFAYLYPTILFEHIVWNEMRYFYFYRVGHEGVKKNKYCKEPLAFTFSTRCQWLWRTFEPISPYHLYHIWTLDMCFSRMSIHSTQIKYLPIYLRADGMDILNAQIECYNNVYEIFSIIPSKQLSENYWDAVIQ